MNMNMDPDTIIDAAEGIVNLRSIDNVVFDRRWMSAFGANPDVCCILWNKNYSKLVEFYRAHGHCNVPRSGNTSPLGEWVSNQRRLKKQHANGVHNSLTSERVALLDAIGFWF